MTTKLANRRENQIINKQQLKSLEVYLNWIQNKVHLEEETKRNYQIKIRQLENRKDNLILLIEQALPHKNNQQSDPASIDNNKNNAYNHETNQNDQFNNNISMVKNKLHSNNQLGINTNSKNLNKLQSPKKVSSNLQNKHKQQHKITNSKNQPKNYLHNINQYKYKDYIQEISTLIKKLNAISNTKYYQTNMSQINRIKNLNNLKDLSNQQKQMRQNLIKELGQIQHLPNINGESDDQILRGLLQNLRKEQHQFVNLICCNKKLLIKKQIKQSLQQKITQNIRLINKFKKNKQKHKQNKQVKSNKDIVKFGYTDQMLQLIQSRNKFAK